MREIQFTPIDLNTWKRGQMFYYFSKMAPTGYSLTVDIDITHMKKVLKERGMKLFPAYLWTVTKLLSEQQEFRIAEKDGQLGEYNYLTPLYASFHDDDKTFSLMWTAFDDDFNIFYDNYIENSRRYGNNHGVLSQPEMLPPPNAYTVSCVPWITFNHFAVHSYDNKPYYFPSAEAGRFFEKDGRTLMPFSLTCHHAAADGYHVSVFLDELQAAVNEFEKYIK